MEETSPKSSPFDVIVVTSPDDLSALAATELISSSFGQSPLTSPSDDSCDEYYQYNDHKNNEEGKQTSPLFLSSCDPYGTKLGSGGGTIAALAEADDAWHCHRGAGDPVENLVDVQLKSLWEKHGHRYPSSNIQAVMTEWQNYRRWFRILLNY